jgi:hypothetical protein
MTYLYWILTGKGPFARELEAIIAEAQRGWS